MVSQEDAIGDPMVDPFYGETLDLVERQAARIPDQRQVILHEDFHFFAHQGRLSGVFDVEMCRLGTEEMQLERMFNLCSPDGIPWESALAGYSEATGRTLVEEDYTFLLAMALFYYHIRITRWGKRHTNRDWVEPFLPDLRGKARQFEGYVDLGTALPSL